MSSQTSSTYKYKSGCKKRQDRKEQEEKVAKLPKLDHFLKNTSKPEELESTSPSCLTQVEAPNGDHDSRDRGQDLAKVVPVSDRSIEKGKPGQEDGPLQPYPTDRGHFDETVLDDAVKWYILMLPCDWQEMAKGLMKGNT